MIWTRARLERMMALRFGFAADGRPDTAAAASAMGVSRRTVQRWLHAHHGRSIAQIPPRRRDQLISLLTPSSDTLARERSQAAYASKAIEGLRLPREMGIKPVWKTQHWLEPHMVVVLEIRVATQRIRQLAVARNTPDRIRELTRRGRVLDHVVVDTRFHATVVTHQMLQQLTPWRFQAGATQVTQGFTQAWIVERSTPAPSLSSVAWALSLPVSQHGASS